MLVRLGELFVKKDLRVPLVIAMLVIMVAAPFIGCGNPGQNPAEVATHRTSGPKPVPPVSVDRSGSMMEKSMTLDSSEEWSSVRLVAVRDSEAEGFFRVYATYDANSTIYVVTNRLGVPVASVSSNTRCTSQSPTSVRLISSIDSGKEDVYFRVYEVRDGRTGFALYVTTNRLGVPKTASPGGCAATPIAK
ncbi:MAG: hypothetical protein Q7S28_00855 [bacterium]|nr:hypothetical protein [bacterium]